MGNAQAKPYIETDAISRDASLILNCLDTGEEGAKSCWKFWVNTYKAKRWPTIKGEDASEARLNGLDLMARIIWGLFKTEEKFVRFCMQTIEGELSDWEAIKAFGGRSIEANGNSYRLNHTKKHAR